MSRVFLILLLILSASFLTIKAQNAVTDTTWNRIDNQGKKQGWWKKSYPDGTLMYKGFFQDDLPYGIFMRYFENGIKKAIMNYYPDGISTYARLYYMNGELAAEGKYVQTQKDSVWKYFSYYTNTLSYIETYTLGIKNGPSTKFYDNGQIAEIIMWESGMKHGKWQQFYEDSTLRLSSAYHYDKLNGFYKVYNTDGILLIDGNYIQDNMDGTWTIYNDDGKMEYELFYDNGKILNGEVLEEKAKKFMEELEKNLGTIPEPDLENIVPDK